MIRVWGRANSVNVQKVLWTLGELALPFERIDAGGAFGQVDKPDYRRLNPNGRVPTIEDDGFVLWESNVIVRYLAAKHGAGRLAPSDGQAHALADQWMDWSLSVLLPIMTPLFWALVRTPPEQRDPAAIARHTQQLGEAMSILDRRLAQSAFVAGPSFSMGDIPVGALTYRWFALDIPRPELPALAEWYARLSERPSYRTTIMLPLS